MRYELEYPVAAQSAASERAAFIRRTYAHVAGGILAFAALVTLLLNLVRAEDIVVLFGGWGFLVVLLAFMGASWLAQLWARSETSRAMQYLGLGLYIVAEAVIFLPLLYICTHYVPDSSRLISTAGILTLAVFGGLTLSVFITKKDYSFLGPILSVGCMLALGLVVAAILFKFTLGVVFAFAMVALVSGCILFQTSNVLHHYRTDQHVAAALALFSSVATLFYYVLYILMMLSDHD
jgi:FtsH-binding integral membrane protein